VYDYNYTETQKNIQEKYFGPLPDDEDYTNAHITNFRDEHYNTKGETYMVRFFWSRLFLYFSESNFASEFTDPSGIQKIRQINPENFWDSG
jgi:hypothetical protein